MPKGFSLALMTQRWAEFDHIKPLFRFRPFEGSPLKWMLSTHSLQGYKGALRSLSKAEMSTPVVTNTMTL
jgi:hypothetical protein